MKSHLKELINQALLDLKREGTVPREVDPDIQIERTRSAEHGDFSSNIAMVLAKPAGMPPRQIAEQLISELLPSKHVERVELAGPGFINFHLTRASQQAVVAQVLREEAKWGHSNLGAGEKVNVEFVSANPTGPLHVGHGRGAAYGASLSRLLDAAGFEVHREYYVNDHGRQMDILATSVWLRYLELCGETVRFPDNGYQGEYVYDIARTVREKHGDDLRRNPVEIAEGLPADGSEGGDKETYIDALVSRAKTLLGPDQYAICFEAALNAIRDDIRDDLSEFNVVFDEWFSERQLSDDGTLEKAIEQLEAAGYVYRKDGAKWFAASRFGDEKDRVVVRENGATTYFASDIAYFLNKLDRGFDHLIYIFGADHHGYIARMQAVAQGLGRSADVFEILLVQFAHLYRGGEKVQMSTRSGSFVTLRELREEVGTDAARFFYVMRSHDQHLDFDLDLAKRQSQDNPVYYIQYAHARISSVFDKLDTRGLAYNQAIGEAELDQLSQDEEITLLRELAEYPEVIEVAARKRAPHLLAHYLRSLAAALQSYYNAHPWIVEDNTELRNARLALARAVQITLANGLDILGVSAPDSM